MRKITSIILSLGMIFGFSSEAADVKVTDGTRRVTVSDSVAPGASAMLVVVKSGESIENDNNIFAFGYSDADADGKISWSFTMPEKRDGVITDGEYDLYIKQDDSPDRPDAESQMKDENSLRSEIKRLIAVRTANPALQSNGRIEFLSDGYPLVYKRSCDEQEILVVINPANKPCEVCCDGKEIIYSAGADAALDSKKITINGAGAAFILL